MLMLESVVDLRNVETYFLFLYGSLFFKQEMELSLIGLQNAGKTSLVNAIAVCECNQI